MLPDEIEKTLRKLGDDGDKVRGALERDFAAYAKEAEKDRGITPLLSTTVAKPLLTRAGRAAAEWFFRTDDEGFPGAARARFAIAPGMRLPGVRRSGHRARDDPEPELGARSTQDPEHAR